MENRSASLRLLSYRTIIYKYDALGRRVQRLMKRSGTTNFTYDGQDVILDQKSDGSTTTYVNGPWIDNKLKQTSSVTGTHYYLQDHLGSTTALTNSSGNVSSQITYDAYGNSTPNALTRYGYTGRELDADTGLMYYRARWYDPQLGRFISEDPIGFAGGDINLYAYAGDNPIRNIDPGGHQEVHPTSGWPYPGYPRNPGLPSCPLAPFQVSLHHQIGRRLIRFLPGTQLT